MNLSGNGVDDGAPAFWQRIAAGYYEHIRSFHVEKTNYKSTLHACYLGYITQALIVNLPPLLFIVFREKFGLSFTMLGSLVLIVFVTQLIVDAAAVKIVDRIGYRASAIIAHAAAV